ncbi:MAG TPA: Holliday junction resolvase RuvX [Saprospiraceae bacterium]|nr:Holliday junction resolvase RuvX [Saprospiraceae bacterium]HMP14246.1 Holliday junction resolvase RuvX [Saprospiraceae bacterium]
MARILAVDYGTKRTGLAVTDPLQIIANGLDTVPTEKVLDYLQRYISQEAVETIVVGEPLHLDGTPAQIAPQVNDFMQKLRTLFPGITIVGHDERFTSADAKKIILQSGMRKKKRRDKALVDKVSAVLILQDYLEHIRYNHS